MESTDPILNHALQQEQFRDLNKNQKEILQLLNSKKGEELLNMIEKDANLIIDAIKLITCYLFYLSKVSTRAQFCFDILKKLIEKFQTVFVWYLGGHKEDFESLITNGSHVDNVKRILECCLCVPYFNVNKTEAQKIHYLAQKVQCQHNLLLYPNVGVPPFIEIFNQINELEQIASNGLASNEFTKKAKSIKNLIVSAQQFNKLNILEQYYLENKKNISQIENNYFKTNGISTTKQLENSYKVTARPEQGLEIKNKQLNIVYEESNNVIRGTPKRTEEIKSGNNRDFTPSRLPYNRSAANIDGLYNNQGNRRFTASGIFNDFTKETPKRTEEIKSGNNRDFTPSRLPYNGSATNIQGFQTIKNNLESSSKTISQIENKKIPTFASICSYDLSTFTEKQQEILEMLNNKLKKELLEMFKMDWKLLVEAVKPLVFFPTDFSALSTRVQSYFDLLQTLITDYQITFIWLLNNDDNFEQRFDTVLKLNQENLKKILDSCLNLPEFYLDKSKVSKIIKLSQKLQLKIEEKSNKPPQSAFGKIYKMIHEANLLEEKDLDPKSQNEINILTSKINQILQEITKEIDKMNPLEKDIIEDLHKKLIGIQTQLSKRQNKNRKRFFLEERLLEDENMTIEYKKYNYPFSDNIKDKLKQTICAFLNKFGGRIYIGVADNKIVSGIKLSRKKRDELKREISQLTENFAPSISTQGLVEVAFIPIAQSPQHSEVIPGLFVVKIIVRQGNIAKLYSFSKENYRAYIRGDAKNIPLDVEAIIQEVELRCTGGRSKEEISAEEFKDPDPDFIEDVSEDEEEEEKKFQKEERYVPNVFEEGDEIYQESGESKAYGEEDEIAEKESSEESEEREIPYQRRFEKIYTVRINKIPPEISYKQLSRVLQMQCFSSIINNYKLVNPQTGDKHAFVNFTKLKEAEMLVQACNSGEIIVGHGVYAKIIQQERR